MKQKLLLLGAVFFGVLAVIGIISALLADLFITPLLVKRFHVYGKEKQEQQ